MARCAHCIASRSTVNSECKSTSLLRLRAISSWRICFPYAECEYSAAGSTGFCGPTRMRPMEWSDPFRTITKSPRASSTLLEGAYRNAAIRRRLVGADVGVIIRHDRRHSCTTFGAILVLDEIDYVPRVVVAGVARFFMAGGVRRASSETAIQAADRRAPSILNLELKARVRIHGWPDSIETCAREGGAGRARL